MLHPSYVELMEAINKNADNGEEPVVTSRYSVVIAAAKRARQLIEHGSGMPEEYQEKKALSVAVEELMTGDVKILPPDDLEMDYEDGSDLAVSGDTVYGLSIDDEDEESEETSEDNEDFEDGKEEYLDDDYDSDSDDEEEDPQDGSFE